METIVDGLVIGSHDYGDSDRIIIIATKEYGKITMLARGVKKSASKNNLPTQDITLSNFEFFHARPDNVSKLKRANLIDNFKEIKGDLYRCSYAHFICNAMSRVIDESIDYTKIYDRFLTLINHLNSGASSEIIFIKTALETLALSGQEVICNGCAVCSRRDEIVTISQVNGGLLCIDHVAKSDTFLSPEVISALYKINNTDVCNIDKLEISPLSKVTLVKIFFNWMKDLTDINLEPLRIINYFN